MSILILNDGTKYNNIAKLRIYTGNVVHIDFKDVPDRMSRPQGKVVKLEDIKQISDFMLIKDYREVNNG